MIDSLIKLGLSPIEARIYQALAEKGPSFVAPLVRITKKHRQIIYNALENLERKNLISVSKKNGKNWYAIGEPRRLLIELKQKEVLAAEIAQEVEQKLKTEQEQVEVFTGNNSYERGLADFRHHAEEAKEYVVIGGEPEEWFEFNKSFFTFHVEEVKRLKRLGITVLILFFESERKSAETYILPHLNNPYHLKISATRPKLPHTSWLAGDHLYMLTPHPSDPLVVHIKSKLLAEEYRKYFWELWKSARVVT